MEVNAKAGTDEEKNGKGFYLQLMNRSRLFFRINRIESEMFEEWIPIKYLFNAYGVFTLNQNANMVLRCILRAYQVFWGSMLPYYLLSIIYSAMIYSEVFFPHIADIFLTAILWFFVTFKMQAFASHMKELNSLTRNRTVRYKNNKLISWVFCTCVLFWSLFNSVRILVKEDIISVLIVTFSFGLIKNEYDSTVSTFSKVFVKTVVWGATATFYIITPLSAATYYIFHLRIQYLVRSLSLRLQSALKATEPWQFLSDFVAELSKAVTTVRKVYSVLSPIALVLASFCTMGLCYSLSKLMYSNPFKGTLSFVSTVINVVVYATLFVLLVIVSAKTGEVFRGLKTSVLESPLAQVEGLSDETKTVKINLLTTMLENFQADISPSAMGFFKLERSVILVTFGAVITYEMMILQMLEKLDNAPGNSTSDFKNYK